jgi:hypothetical protein
LSYYNFYLSTIASLGRKDYFCIPSSDRKDDLVRKDASNFQHHVIVLNTYTLLVLKFDLRWISLSKEY